VSLCVFRAPLQQNKIRVIEFDTVISIPLKLIVDEDNKSKTSRVRHWQNERHNGYVKDF
jgi:hypothetical protein